MNTTLVEVVVHSLKGSSLRGNKKISRIILAMLMTFTVVIILIVTFNFRDFSQQQAINKAKITAELIRDGLTAHMVNGIMDERALFLQNVKHGSKAEDLWIFRTQKVIEQYGSGFNSEVIRDEIDQNVVKSAKTIHKINDSLKSATLRITIPYVATAYGTPNCLECHTTAKEGDVLGGITMIFNIDEIRTAGAITIFKIFIISLLSITGFIFVANRQIKPYLDTLDDIQSSLEKANHGDYTNRIKIDTNNESAEVSKWLNTLLDKLEGTIGAIEHNISLFVSDRKMKYSDPLIKSKFVIEDLAMIYKFKKTIEHDKSKEVIYDRLVHFFKETLNVNDLSLYEINIQNDTRTLIYDDTPEKFCSIADSDTSTHCRAYRTNSIVSSDEFPNLCQACETNKEYLCINYPISDNISLVLNIKPSSLNELHENKKAIGYIRNYLESAKPVLQSKILTEILQQSNMIDGLTGLHNRKYLDEFMDKVTKTNDNFGIIMLDIDFFKKVNDTYGHDSGDEVIRALSEVLKESSGTNDISFRFGGEEFIVYVHDVENAVDLANTIRVNFEKLSFNFNNENIKKTLSAGVTSYPQDASTVWKAIKYADLALYEAKESGRNRVIKFHDGLIHKT